MGLVDKFKKKMTGPMYLYTEEEYDQYEKYIVEQFGEYKEVLHEIISPDIHLDIIIIPPTEENNYYTLVSMGMGAYKMHVPKELKQYELERAEVVMCLPPTWNIKSDKEEDYWPIRQLKIIARLPINCKTWLGFGHTVSNDEENTAYADSTDLCSMMLVTAVNKDFETMELRLGKKGKINFYQLLPLYREELEYKQAHDANDLIDLFGDDITPVIDPERPNYALDE